MNRRAFLSLSALSAVPVGASAADDAPETECWDTIDSTNTPIRRKIQLPATRLFID